ncbi:uncharacterized protein LAESUDRAFT_722002 [Laetiporus sulphureus 93-53]|uniref:Transcription factor hoxa13 n=1 Tax=Laetiporus sulphureus 93-53 TaxID=1314785 RepID=A0A165G5E2_9APHY|nr:uncharacterized protein LAESUDRAFT_722002 [Laetiporus sulphureus 93-53]KZT09852.1 hypothetical protein LAESUDRAFT_722002 [Laetiporus sulphureus 93-53]
MVVPRRAPVPPPAGSRANSAQQVQRVKAKSVAPTAMPSTHSPLVNGDTTESDVQNSYASVGGGHDSQSDMSMNRSPKSKSKLKSKKGRKKSSKKGTGVIEFLSRIFLLWFVIYTVSVCPEDVRHESAICRGLAEYRRLVIEPYILPPIQMALSHPSVAPYVEKVKPVTDRAVNITKPIALRALREWNARVVPQWNKHVVPQWNKRVVPLWFRYAVPQLLRIDAHFAPYRMRIIQEYQRHVAPVVRQVSPYVQRAVFAVRWGQQKARPYVVLAAHKTYDAYQRVMPYARPLWEKTKLLTAKLVAVLAEKRRQFVDPHVQRIWEQVKELSSGKPRVPTTTDMHDSITSRVSQAASGATSIASSLMSASTPHTSVASDNVDATSLPVIPDVFAESKILPSSIESISPTSFSVDAAEKVASTASVASNFVDATASSIKSASAPSASVSSGMSFLSDTASHASSAASASSEKLASSASSVKGAASKSPLPSSVVKHASAVISSGIDQASSLVSSVAETATSSGVSSIASAIPSHAIDADIDLEAFYAELGLDDIIPSAATSSSVPPSSQKAETEEEQEERARVRAIQTAEKRAELMARHARWEDQLAAEIESSKKALRKALVASRKTAAAELRESAEIQDEIESLVEEADKFLRGAEKYLQTLSTEGRTDEEKRIMWGRVVDKVDQKFVERLGETEAVVNGWYAPVLDKELAEVRKIADAVRDIADRAQTDIGMDYAYLDDVTYNDWQRYHDLLRTSDNFTAQANAIQDGSDPSSPVNPLLKEIENLQSEVQDVVVGFETRLRRIKRTGERALGEGVKPEDSVPEDEEDETISILPIEDDEKVQTPADINIPPVVIGRSKEEVMDALSRAAAAEEAAISSLQATEQTSDVEEVVHSLTEEENASQGVPTAVPSTAHVEL